MKNKGHIILIFIIFISLGLPDGIIGNSWPAIRETFHFQLNTVSLLTMGIFVGSFSSSILYPYLSRKYSMVLLIESSIILIIIGLYIFSILSSSFLIVIPVICLGLGAGCIDVAVNDYVSANYSQRVMAWVHGCWGIGVTAGAGVLATVLSLRLSWKIGFQCIALLELLVLFMVYKNRGKFQTESKRGQSVDHRDKIEEGITEKLTQAHFMGPFFCFFYGVEYVLGLYFSTYLIQKVYVSIGEAAFIVSSYWFFLSLGRFVTGVLIRYLLAKWILYAHLILSIVGALFLLIPHKNAAIAASAMIGYGFSALFPVMMSMPQRLYESKMGTRIISFQISFQALGVIVLPILYGYMFKTISLGLMPVSIMISMSIMIGLNYRIQKQNKKKQEEYYE